MTWENILKQDKPLLDMRRINNLYSPYIAYHVAGLIEEELYGKLRTIPYNEKISDALEYCIGFEYKEFQEKIFSGSKGDYGIADKEAEGLYNDGKKFGGKFTIKVRWEKPMQQFEGVEEIGKKLDGVELDIEYEGSWAKNYQGVKLEKGQNVKNFKLNTSSIKKQLDEALGDATIKRNEEEYEVMIGFLDTPKFRIESLQDLIGRAYMDYGGTIGDDPARNYPKQFASRFYEGPTSKTKKESWRGVLRTKGRGSDEKVDAYMKALDIDNDPESIADMQSGKKLIQNDVEIDEGISVEDFYKIMDKANMTEEKLEEEAEEADAEGRNELLFYLQGEMSSLGKLDLNIMVPNLEERDTKRSRYGYIDGTYTPLTFSEYMKLDDMKAKQHIFEIKKVKEGFMGIFEEVKTLGE